MARRVPRPPGRVVGRVPHGTMRSRERFDHRPDTVTPTAELRGLTGDDAGLILAVGVAGTILRSEDHGQSWRELTVSTTSNLAAAWRGPAGTLFIAGDGGTILRSRDRGLTWEPRRSDTTVALEHLAGHQTEVVVAGAAGTVLCSRDDGDTWVAVAMPTIPEPERRPPSRLLRDRDAPRPPPGDDEVVVLREVRRDALRHGAVLRARDADDGHACTTMRATAARSTRS